MLVLVLAVHRHVLVDHVSETSARTPPSNEDGTSSFGDGNDVVVLVTCGEGGIEVFLSVSQGQVVFDAQGSRMAMTLIEQLQGKWLARPPVHPPTHHLTPSPSGRGPPSPSTH